MKEVRPTEKNIKKERTEIPVSRSVLLLVPGPTLEEFLVHSFTFFIYVFIADTPLYCAKSGHTSKPHIQYNHYNRNKVTVYKIQNCNWITSPEVDALIDYLKDSGFLSPPFPSACPKVSIHISRAAAPWRLCPSEAQTWVDPTVTAGGKHLFPLWMAQSTWTGYPHAQGTQQNGDIVPCLLQTGWKEGEIDVG